jgi:signal transduction histidine kinase
MAVRVLHDGGGRVRFPRSGGRDGDRFRLQERLRESARLESLGTLARGIAHDMNNLLQPIMTSTEVLRQRNAGDRDAEGDVAVILEATHRARALVRQVLDFGRRVAPCPEVVDLFDVVRDSRQLVAAALSSGAWWSPWAEQ